MPSQRRMRGFACLLALVVFVTIYFNSGAQRTVSSDFYTRTQEALQAKEYAEAARERDALSVGERLKAAEEAAKRAASDKSQKFFESVEGSSDGGSGGGAGAAAEKDRGVAGRVKLNGEEKEAKKMLGVANVGGKPRDRHVEVENETVEDHEVEVELNAILRQSPIIIFSKSHCPHSQLAKNILLKKYKIVPTPYVVELDLHPLGAQLQHTLAESTHRRTVPNVLLMGRSIGGGDDIEDLDLTDKLISTVKSMGGSRIMEASLRSEADLADLKI